MKNQLLCLVFLLMGSMSAWAQSKVSGTVTASDGFPLPGVNIMEKGTTNGTISDIDGNYNLEVSDNATLMFSFTGFATTEMAVTSSGTIDIVLAEGVALDEVVVTALGIEKNKKALAYSVTEVDASNFGNARETNVLNSLAGKVAGVNISDAATGAGGSTRVVIRGNNSLSGNNQPLFVVDGMPIDNTQLGSAGMWGGSDGGDGISSINPDDIESVSVLKGTSASALYGYRASNGVILINTKSGKARQGIGVEFTSQIRVESIIDQYDFQQEYGHGTRGMKPGDQATALDNGLVSWGARLDGSDVVQFDGVSRPYSYAGNNLDRFYDSGTTWTNTLALSGGNEKHNYRLSFTNLDNADVVPNSGLDRRNVTIRQNSKFSDKLSSSLSLTYVNEKVKNRPRLSDSPGNANYAVGLLPTTVNVNDLRGDEEKLGAEVDGSGFERQFNGNVFVTNPWWGAYQFENSNTKNRLLGNFRMRYDLMEGLYVQGRIGMDRYNNRTRSVEPYGTAYKNFGQVNEANREVQEMNMEVILGYDGRISDDIGISALVGGNQQMNKDENLGINGSQLSVPFLHSIANAGQLGRNYQFNEWEVASHFASLELSFIDAIYLTGTIRRDAFSTLTKPVGDSDNSTLTPSVGVSWVFSDMLDMPDWLTYGKVRGSWAQVPGATDPYQLSLTYGVVGQGHLGLPLGAISNSRIPNENLKPVTATETEFGVDLRFLNNRLGVDFAVYDRSTEDDILFASVPQTSGFGQKVVNIGKMENRGVELLLTVTPVRTADLRWDLTFNYSKNNNKVISLLTPEVDPDDPERLRVGESRTRNAYIEHVEGLPYSQIAGWSYARNADGSIELDDQGLPVQGEFTHFGTGVHPTQMGISNSIQFKDLSLSFLIDIKQGGYIYGATNAYSYNNGLHQATLVGREGGIGQVAAADIQNYYNRVAFSITEEFVQEADFAKLREVVLGYTLRKDKLGDFPFQSVTVSLAGRNLGLLASKTDNFDPESTYSSGNAQGLEMFGVPQTRSVMASVNVKF